MRIDLRTPTDLDEVSASAYLEYIALTLILAEIDVGLNVNVETATVLREAHKRTLQNAVKTVRDRWLA